ncbi:hypothetical protein [Zhihengliuella halotolerans]|uniref:Uncharacterized protein n=1 Tax=Zhihengliuella halotolerans TaxID=370736 RepID=A0A4V2GA43_9MICC|nr:hypothetical protein [Zhihengliuella halotolerans]RZU62776.1 hypothetical protein EV380_2379 [Zhihengliuella halotolerans]
MGGKLARLITVIAVLGLASGCGSGDDEPDSSPAPGGATSSASAGVVSPPGEDEEADVSVPECGGILLEEGGSTSGEELGGCISAAMVAAGSGVHRVETSDGESQTVSFRWNPDFEMSAEGGQAVVIKGDDGWIRDAETGAWIKGDAESSDPQALMAGTIVELVRVASHPEMIAATIAAADTWTIVEEGEVPVDDAVAERGWLFEPAGPMEVLGVELTDYKIWLTPDYLGVYAEATGTTMGQTVTTRDTFLEWGEPVEIPDPEAE